MANNRMWLVCTACNKGVLIAKYYPSVGWDPFELTTNWHYDFLQKHTLCGHGDEDDVPGVHRAYGGYGPVHFEVQFEGDEINDREFHGTTMEQK